MRMTGSAFFNQLIATLILAGLVLTGYLLFARPYQLRWGATDKEVVRPIFQSMLLGPWMSMTGSKKMTNQAAKPNQKDLAFIKGLLEAGKVVPV